MDKQKLEKKYEDAVKEMDGIVFKSIEAVNFNPHPYMVGSKHVEHASDHHGGMLGDATMNAIPCAHRGCNMSLSEHTYDKVMMLSLTRDVTKEETESHLKSLVELGMEADGIDGFTFVETEEKYRVQ